MWYGRGNGAFPERQDLAVCGEVLLERRQAGPDARAGERIAEGFRPHRDEICSRPAQVVRMARALHATHADHRQLDAGADFCHLS